MGAVNRIRCAVVFLLMNRKKRIEEKSQQTQASRAAAVHLSQAVFLHLEG